MEKIPQIQGAISQEAIAWINVPQDHCFQVTSQQ